MKKITSLVIIALSLVIFFNGKKYNELVTSRLDVSVAVCLEGQDCGKATPIMVASNDNVVRSADIIYSSGCAACHDAGVAGAPMTGNKSQWESRQVKGYETLVNNVWNGINGMPAKGLCINCTKEEIEIAVQYMLDAI
jgi:cytochrome c5